MRTAGSPDVRDFLKAKKDVVQDSFRFFAPLSPTLWAYIGGTLFLVSFAVALFNKISPYDYHGGFIQEDHQLTNEWKVKKKYLKVKKRNLATMNFLNSTWTSVATLLQQGAEVYPMSVTGKIPAALWFLLALLVTATYTANLSAFLTQSRLQGEINSVDDLVAQTQVKYGAVRSSAVVNFFAESTVPTYQSVYLFIKKFNTEVQDTDEGVKRTRAGSYAFIHDSSVLDYESQKPPCELRLVGKIFWKLGYGFGLQKNSPFREELSLHITQLRENGYLEELKKKWLHIQGGCADATVTDTTNTLNRLGVTSVLGVFYIIYAGLGFAFVTLIYEWFVACAYDVKEGTHLPGHPRTMAEAFRQRRDKLRREFVADVGRKLFSGVPPKMFKKNIVGVADTDSKQQSNTNPGSGRVYWNRV